MLEAPAWAKKARRLGCRVETAAKVVVAPAEEPDMPTRWLHQSWPAILRAPRRKADAELDRLAEQHAGVEGPRQLNPEDKPARGSRHSGSGRKASFDCPCHPVDVSGENTPDPAQMAVVTSA